MTMGDGSRLAVPETAGRMAGAAAAFLAGLTETQRGRACRPFGDERRDWSFLPEPERDGLPIGALDDGQRRLAHELIAAGTSLPGYTKVVSVMAMEHVLRALVPGLSDLFNPERYSLRVFGSPGEEVWGWQLAGHHVSLNFTVTGGRWVSPTPCMLGAEPASYALLAPLADDEELGFRFVNSLDPAQRAAAIIHHRPPPDLAARMVPRIGEVERPDPVFAPEPDYVISDEERDVLSYVRSGPKGLPGSALNRIQLDDLAALVGSFVRRLPDELAGAQLLCVGRRHLARGAALLPHPGADAARRARQHPGERQPHPLGVAQPGRRFRGRRAGRALPAAPRRVRPPALLGGGGRFGSGGGLGGGGHAGQHAAQDQGRHAAQPGRTQHLVSDQGAGHVEDHDLGGRPQPAAIAGLGYGWGARRHVPNARRPPGAGPVRQILSWA
jgi:Protein of unknown function (DUF3500)